jgi:hypothetical protein
MELTRDGIGKVKKEGKEAIEEPVKLKLEKTKLTSKMLQESLTPKSPFIEESWIESKYLKGLQDDREYFVINFMEGRQKFIYIQHDKDLVPPKNDPCLTVKQDQMDKKSAVLTIKAPPSPNIIEIKDSEKQTHYAVVIPYKKITLKIGVVWLSTKKDKEIIKGTWKINCDDKLFKDGQLQAFKEEPFREIYDNVNAIWAEAGIQWEFAALKVDENKYDLGKGKKDEIAKFCKAQEKLYQDNHLVMFFVPSLPYDPTMGKAYPEKEMQFSKKSPTDFWANTIIISTIGINDKQGETRKDNDGETILYNLACDIAHEIGHCVTLPHIYGATGGSHEYTFLNSEVVSSWGSGAWAKDFFYNRLMYWGRTATVMGSVKKKIGNVNTYRELLWLGLTPFGRTLPSGSGFKLGNDKYSEILVARRNALLFPEK